MESARVAGAVGMNAAFRFWMKAEKAKDTKARRIQEITK
jgi:hypothetical protein